MLGISGATLSSTGALPELLHVHLMQLFDDLLASNQLHQPFTCILNQIQHALKAFGPAVVRVWNLADILKSPGVLHQQSHLFRPTYSLHFGLRLQLPW